MFRCICSSVRSLSLSSVIVVLKKGFIWRRAEKVRFVIVVLKKGFIWHRAEKFSSASQDVTGIVLSIFNSVEIGLKPSKASPHWFNASIRHQLKVHSLRRRIKRHSTQILRTRLMQMERDLQSLIQSAKENYLMQLVTTFRSNPRKLYT